jgi:hypothetical protein
LDFLQWFHFRGEMGVLRKMVSEEKEPMPEAGIQQGK